MEDLEIENFEKSVGCVVLKGNQVLLVRHTYGPAQGKLLIPGGYLHKGELPEDAAAREVREETRIEARAQRLLAMRFNKRDWYAVFLMSYLGGEAVSDGKENSEALFLPVPDALQHPHLTDLTRVLLQSLLQHGEQSYGAMDFRSNAAKGPYSLYGVGDSES